MASFDWNAFRAAGGVGRNELRAMGAKSGARNAGEAIQANKDAKSCSSTGVGNALANYSKSSSSSVSSCSGTSNAKSLAGMDASQLRGTGDPEQDAKNLAKQLRISVDEAKELLRAQFGDPQQPKQFMA